MCCHGSIQGKNVKGDHSNKEILASNTALHASLSIQWVSVEAGRKRVREEKISNIRLKVNVFL